MSFTYAQCCVQNVVFKIYPILIFLKGKIEIVSHLFLHLEINIPIVPTYGVYISQFIRYTRSCSLYSDFVIKSLSSRNQTIQSRNFKEGTGYEYDGNVFVAWVLQVRRAEVVTK